HLLEPQENRLSELRDVLARLSPYAAIFRYPGESATRRMAGQALEHAQLVREAARELLGLSLDE
ncbi:MAG: HEPN domain-containing protein, partial [Armatimonadota bacterium]